MKLHEYNNFILSKHVSEGDTVIDATCGNGHDTIFLSNLVGEKGLVLAFDLQKEAINSTKSALLKHNISNTKLFHDGHENISAYINDMEISAAVFNLGFLPRSDKKIITKKETSLKACEQILKNLKLNGVLSIHCYSGHTGGDEEASAIYEFAKQLSNRYYYVVNIEQLNKDKNKENLILIIKTSNMA